MIDIRKLKELVRLMVENELVEIDLRDQQDHVSIKRPGAMAVPMVTHHVTSRGDASAAAHTASAAGGAASTASSSADAGLVPIESPMVGTFYPAPGPDKPPFVAVGASVGPESVVCLLEAMKIFNEIKAGVSGTVERVLVRSGEAVEFGQPLFMVRPG